MSRAGQDALAFHLEVARSGILWTVRDERGYPVSVRPGGQRIQPFWSSRERAERITKTVPTFSRYAPEEIAWSRFVAEWVAALDASKTLVGVNWSGPTAAGIDMPARDVVREVEAARDRDWMF